MKGKGTIAAIKFAWLNLSTVVGKMLGFEGKFESNQVEESPAMAELPPVDRQVVDAQTKFGFKLFQEILQEEGDKNVFVSPTSVAIALSMLYNGAAGETKPAIAKALELEGLSLNAVNQGNQSLQLRLENADPDVKVDLAPNF